MAKFQTGKHLTASEQRKIISAMRSAHYWLHDSGDAGDMDVCKRLRQGLAIFGIDTSNDEQVYNAQIAS